MKEFYEQHRDNGKIYVSRNSNHLFPAHFHLDPEILIVKQGGYDITLSGKNYSVGEGCIAVMDSYETHSYDMRIPYEEYDDAVIILPRKCADKFYNRHEDMRIAEPVICDRELCRCLMNIVDEYLSSPTPICEAAAELLLAKLEERLTFCQDRQDRESSLIRQILTYVQNNYTENITRGSIARALGYTEAHISRVFHSYIGKGISDYVNSVRLLHVDKMLATGDKRNITELIYEAGFGSQQTYYRARRKELC